MACNSDNSPCVSVFDNVEVPRISHTSFGVSVLLDRGAVKDLLVLGVVGSVVDSFVLVSGRSLVSGISLVVEEEACESTGSSTRCDDQIERHSKKRETGTKPDRLLSELGEKVKVIGLVCYKRW